ncbi:unnamed protein product [Effrenium voratum]|nr:unnamed protein product [Effrenium voratum]
MLVVQRGQSFIVKGFSGGDIISVGELTMGPAQSPDVDLLSTLTMDDMKGMLSQLSVKVSNISTKDRLVSHIATTWGQITSLSLSKGSIRNPPANSKMTLVIIKNDNGVCLLKMPRGAVYELETLKKLTPSTPTREDLNTLTLSQLRSLMQNLGHFISGKSKAGAVEYILKNWDAIAPHHAARNEPIATDEEDAETSEEEECCSGTEKDEGSASSSVFIWTEAHEKRLKLMRQLNPPNALIKVNPDELWMLEDMKRSYIAQTMGNKKEDFEEIHIGVTDDMNLDGENIKKLGLEVPTASGSFKVFYVYEMNKARGEDLRLALEKSLNIDMTLFVIKFSRSASTLNDWDGIDAYYTDEVVFKLTPALHGGGKGTKKATTKSAVAQEKAKALEKSVKSIFNGIATNEADLKQCVATCDGKMSAFYTKAEADPINTIQALLTDLDEDLLQNAYSAVSADTGGSAEYKLKKASAFLFGKEMVAIKDTSQMTQGILEGAELTICLAYNWAQSKSEKFGMPQLREMLKTELTKRVGAREALAKTAGAANMAS